MKNRLYSNEERMGLLVDYGMIQSTAGNLPGVSPEHSSYKCCCQPPWTHDSSSQTFPCVWRGWIYPVQLWWLHHFCPVCSRCFKESYLVPLSLFSTCTFGFCCHNFLLLIILFSIRLRVITGKFVHHLLSCFIQGIKSILWFWL